MSTTQGAGKLRLGTKVAYGLGDWGNTTTSTIFIFFFAFFLTDVARLPPARAALVLLIGGICDAVAYMLFDTCFTLMTVPYSALTAGFTDDYDERTALTGWRMATSMLGGLVAAFFVPLIVGAFVRSARGYLAAGAGFGLLACVPYLMLFFTTRERFAASLPRNGASEGPCGGPLPIPLRAPGSSRAGGPSTLTMRSRRGPYLGIR